MEGDWITVWDFRDAFPWDLAIAPALSIMSILIFAFYARGFLFWLSDVFGPFWLWTGRVFCYPTFVLGLFVGIAATYFGTTHYLGQRSAFANGDYAVSEGMATVINPSPVSAEQVLEVGGESFEYSVHEGAFNFAGRFTDGGIVRTGMNLRISYIDGEILRVERREQPEADTA
ncbi:hypothetical protein [Hyphobacterium sp.]|uniref:hypothetical protein n=1 Tax=Hyphobacterium sp. TaxID=2004662 RepID=UPI00374A6E1F